MNHTIPALSIFNEKLTSVMSSCPRPRQGAEGKNSGDMHINLNQLRTFIVAAMNEGSNGKTIAEALGMSQSTASRHLLDLSIQDRNRKQGFGLLTYSPDPNNLRSHIYELTHKGRQLVAILTGIAS